MLTGDGLLARLIPSAPIPFDTWVALCDASQTHGNGIVEVTQRGSLQIRGLSPASAPAFAATATALGLGSEGGPPILSSPLLGLDAQERVDLRPLVTALRVELARHADVASLGPKVSLLIDAGGALHLDQVAADLRLRMSGASRFHVSIAGIAADSSHLGWVDAHHAVNVIVQILAAVANRGPNARARDFANGTDLHALRDSLAGILTDEPPPASRSPADAIGTHRLNSGRLARGFALAFGYIEARALKRFALAAADCGATSMQPAPGRALLSIGMSGTAAEKLTAVAKTERLIVRPDDARRYVIACAGAPACRSATLATRQWAPHIAEAAKPLLDGSCTIHVSGCVKGCAYPGVATLTLVGSDRIVVRGRAGDAPHGTISAGAFVAGLRRLSARPQTPLAAVVHNADFVSTLGACGMAQPKREESARD